MNKKICVLGLGYVGLPLAVALSKKRKIIGFDTDKNRIDNLNNFYDRNKEISSEDLKKYSLNLEFSSKESSLKDCNFYIVTVPTPVDKNNIPDLRILASVSELIGKALNKNNIVVFESTVYPGATEEFCVPLLEKFSGLKFNKDFYCGYSPERINPGDKIHTIDKVVKVTSGSTPEAAKIIDNLYKEVTNNNTFKTSSIRVAEAAKVIENTQRDINIALMNELSQIFLKLGIETNEVLEAAGTKWNFLQFSPGLVGGHCIGVDPYYLTYKAKQAGFDPKIILAGRKTNDDMAKHIASNIKVAIENINKKITDVKILIMGATFKENCPDTRNSKVFDIINFLKEMGNDPFIYDPEASWNNEIETYKDNIIDKPSANNYDLIVLAVPHEEFIKSGIEGITKFGKEDFIFFDLKSAFSNKLSQFRL